jgi:2-oxo-4-hydroxy-4-carboxy-5-ureidoimidazoline decarboxylase
MVKGAASENHRPHATGVPRERADPSMDLNYFNSATASEARTALKPCADIDRWVEELVAARPYASVEELVERAQQAAAPFTPVEVDAALAHHPRIGERAEGSSTEATMSRGEQSAVDAASETAQQIRRGNVAYEDRFGRVFLIRAAGRSAEEILAQLERRLGNTPDDEAGEVAGQLREIALLRLRGLFNQS